MPGAADKNENKKKTEVAKEEKVKGAKRVAKQVKKTADKSLRGRKVWKSATFRRPVTLALARKPKYTRTPVKGVNTFDKFEIIKHPVANESAMRTIEENNTLVFIVDIKANKRQIRKAVQDLYSIKVGQVNTLVTMKGQKKAYIRLGGESTAIDVANKIGIM